MESAMCPGTDGGSIPSIGRPQYVEHAACGPRLPPVHHRMPDDSAAHCGSNPRIASNATHGRSRRPLLQDFHMDLRHLEYGDIS